MQQNQAYNGFPFLIGAMHSYRSKTLHDDSCSVGYFILSEDTMGTLAELYLDQMHQDGMECRKFPLLLLQYSPAQFHLTIR